MSAAPSPLATLSDLPEELLERILAHTAPALADRRAPPQLAPLLSCTAFARIGRPLYARSVALRTPHQATAFLALVAADPELARGVRALAAAAPCAPALPALLRACAGARVLELELPADGAAPGSSYAGVPPVDTAALAAALAGARDIRSLTLRKPPVPGSGYTSGPQARAFLTAVACAVPAWAALDTVTLALRLSPGASPEDGVSLLVGALVRSPALHTLRTCLPAVWNPALLALSANPTLARIELSQGEHGAFFTDEPPAPIDARNLYMRAARAHARLMTLIRVGTPVGRARAETLPAPQAPASPVVVAAPGWSIVVPEESGSDSDAAGALPPPSPKKKVLSQRPSRAFSASTAQPGPSFVPGVRWA